MTVPPGLDPDWVPEPARPPADRGHELPAFGAMADASGGAMPELPVHSSRFGPVRLKGWHVGGIVVLVLLPFLAWFLWSGLVVEQTFAVDEPLSTRTAPAWPSPQGLVPPAPLRTNTYPSGPTPSLPYGPPPTITLPGSAPSPLMPTARSTQFPPNLRPTPLPGGARPTNVPTSATKIRVELSGPTNRPYTVFLGGSGTATRQSFQGQTGTVALELPATSLVPSPTMPMPLLAADVRAPRPDDTVACRIVVAGVTVAYQQGRTRATCTVTSGELGWK
ncbi:MAG: hypothetical protein ACTHJJ_03665 [Intrasporangium sp.]|uniref:hypothetical protein n=1 Tax=Intrasporangium sp. TaxID=1925024 RepID=UPI003F81F3EF